MMKKLLLAAVLLLVGATVNAYAVPITINVDELYDWGRLYSYSGDMVSGTYTTTNSNPGVVGDTAIGTTITANTIGNADGKEDTWGIGSIASIKTIPANDPVFLRSGSQELTFMFYGFDDDALSTPNFVGDTTILSKLGHIAVYL